MPTCHDAMRACFTVVHSVSRGKRYCCKNAIPRKRIALHRVPRARSTIPRHSFRDDVFRESSLPDAVVEEDKVGRTFVAVTIEHGTGKVHFQKKYFTRRIHAEVHACVAHAVKRLEHPTCSVLQFGRQPRIAHRNIRPRMQIARFQRVRLEGCAFRKLVLDRG